MKIIGGKTIMMKYILIVLFLCFTTSIPAEEIICEVERPSIIDRVVNKSNPSVFGAWGHVILNSPRPSNVWEWPYYKSVVSRRDMFWQGSFLAKVAFQNLTPEGSQLVFRGGGDSEYADYIVDQRNQIQALNPDFLFLHSLYYYGIHPEDGYPEEWPYWLRDEEGNRIRSEGYDETLIDYTLPGAEEHFVKMAVSVAKCGIFDGLLLDLWGEVEENISGTEGTAHLYHGNRVEALVSLVKRIREAVGDEFLIIINPNDRKSPRSAPYVNGAFIETWYGKEGISHKEILKLENALSWNEKNLRYPQVNCLEVSQDLNEPWDSPANQRWARLVTALTLTHSNGYIRISGHPPPDEIYWYPFWDAPLGGTLGSDETKGVLYETPKGEKIEGLFIREFTNGWAIYNRSGTEQEIELPQEASGWSSGVANQRRHTLADLDGEIYLKAETPPTADVNGDGTVNILDLVSVANAFGEAAPDLNGDGTVNVLDLVAVANAFE